MQCFQGVDPVNWQVLCNNIYTYIPEYIADLHVRRGRPGQSDFAARSHSQKFSRGRLGLSAFPSVLPFD